MTTINKQCCEQIHLFEPCQGRHGHLVDCKCNKAIVPTEDMGWNREKIEDELREQLYTLLHVTSAMQPKSDEEFMAVALPNLVLWAHSVFQENIKEAVRTQIAAAEERGRQEIKQKPILMSGNNLSVEEAYHRGQEEERQFILNVLAGVDAADKEMGLGQNTKAIRLALKSRHIGALNALPVSKEKEI